MTLYNTPSLILFNEAATASLPDPTTVDGRTHDLTQGDGTACVWSSTGTNPFMVDGGATATLTVPRGSSTRVHSTGGKWTVVRPSGTRRVFADSAVSDASGNAVFTFTPPFPSVPKAAAAIQFAAGSNPIDYRITALTASSCTVNVRQSPTLVVLSLSVLGVAAPLSGVTVHLHAVEVGQG